MPFSNLKNYLLWMAFVLSFFMSCAFMKKENRVITNALDEAINPESTTSKVLLSPIAVPLGTASLLVDTLVLHPISVIPKSIGKTYEILWQDSNSEIVVQAFLFIPKLVFTPITLVAVWAFYSLFD